MKILCVLESFLPGTAGGGPVRAVLNWARIAGKQHEIRIFTRNRDYLSAEPYPDIAADRWVECPGSRLKVWYAADPAPRAALRACLRDFAPDWLYLHGALPPFTRDFLRLRRRVSEFQALPILLAPHGNLAPATLGRRAWRKRLWLAYARTFALYRGLRWHAASEREAEQIRAVFGAEAADIRVVPMAPEFEPDRATERQRPDVARQRGDPGSAGLPPGMSVPEPTEEPQPSRGSAFSGEPPLRLVYFGRVSSEKNLGFALERLGELAASPQAISFSFDFVGPDQDGEEERLRARAAALGLGERVRFVGALPPAELRARLHGGEWDALVLPSFSENFSYTVLESLQAGLAVVVSDQTPWRALETDGVGWDLPLADPAAWRAALLALAAEPPAVRASRSARARAYAQAWAADYPRRAETLFAT